MSTSSIKFSKTSHAKDVISGEKVYSTGRRKESSARVWIARGSGKIVVNSKSLDDYIERLILRVVVNQPFVVTDTVGKYDVWCTVKGGGISGQAAAIRHGISLALRKDNTELGALLRQAKLVTRDSRKVERKKYGRKKARASFQFSKR